MCLWFTINLNSNLAWRFIWSPCQCGSRRNVRNTRIYKRQFCLRWQAVICGILICSQTTCCLSSVNYCDNAALMTWSTRSIQFMDSLWRVRSVLIIWCLLGKFITEMLLRSLTVALPYLVQLLHVVCTGTCGALFNLGSDRKTIDMVRKQQWHLFARSKWWQSSQWKLRLAYLETNTVHRWPLSAAAWINALNVGPGNRPIWDDIYTHRI